MVLVMHVEDVLGSAKATQTKEEFIAHLHMHSTVKDLGYAIYYLGCRIVRSKAANQLRMDSCIYIDTSTDNLLNEQIILSNVQAL